MFEKITRLFKKDKKEGLPPSSFTNQQQQEVDNYYSDDSGDDSKRVKEDAIVLIKLSQSEAHKYRNLMRQQDIAHCIIMSGYLRWKDVVHCMMVCREWNELLECTPGYNMFIRELLHSLDTRFRVGFVPTTLYQKDDQNVEFENNNNRKLFNIQVMDKRTLKDFLRFTKYAMSWYNLSRFGYLVPDGVCAYLMDLMSIQTESIRVKEMKVLIPQSLLGGRRDAWNELTSPLWNNDGNCNFGIFMAFRSRFQYRYSFTALAYLSGTFYLVGGKPKEIIPSFVIEKFESGEDLSSSDSEIAPKRKRFKAQTKNDPYFQSNSEFELCNLTEEFASELIFLSGQDPVVAEEGISKEFNSLWRKMLFNVWRSGFLYYRPVRNYIFQLLFILMSPITDYHSFQFSENISDSNVMNNVEQLLSSKRGNCEIFHSYLNINMACSAYSGGKSVKYYFVALILKPPTNEASDECEFEFVTYKYFSYFVRGIALS